MLGPENTYARQTLVLSSKKRATVPFRMRQYAHQVKKMTCP